MNLLRQATLLPAFLSSHSDGPSATESTLSALDSLSDQLFDLRSSLAQSNIPSFTVSPDAISSRKRKRASSSSDDLDAHEAALSDLRTLEEALAPHVTSTLNKWSAKVSAASATGQGNKFALKAVNQSAVAQIEAALAGDGFERLVARTRVYRPAASGNDAGRLGVVSRSAIHLVRGELYSAQLALFFCLCNSPLQTPKLAQHPQKVPQTPPLIRKFLTTPTSTSSYCAK